MRKMLALLLSLCFVCLTACAPDTPPDSGTTTSVSISTTTADTDGTGTTADAGTTSTTQVQQTTTTTKSVNKAVSKMSYSPSIQGLPGTKSKELMENPERGFYMEMNMNVATGLTMGGKDAIQEITDQIGHYSNEKPQLAQNYFYLTDYSDRDLDQAAFDKMQAYFDVLKANNIQSCIRFAYEYNESNNVVGPTTDQIIRHTKQLKAFLEHNKDTIHVVQAGFIGLWGEWHTSVHEHDRTKVLQAIVDMTPEGKMVQVRLASYKDVLPADDPRRARVSYHDDYLVGVDHAWSTVTASNTRLYIMVMQDVPSMLVAGEMPWGSDQQFNNGVIDGLFMAMRLQEYHYTAISITHNYIESGIYCDYNMSRWQSETVTEEGLKAAELRYAPSWFKDESGNTTTRSLFAYIRDYLGYYIEAADVKATVSGNTVKATLTLKNYGFSAPHGMKTMELVLLDADGKILDRQSLCEMNALQPGSEVSAQADLTASALEAGYSVGIRFVNAQGTSAHLANDVTYRGGVNVLLTLE